MPSVVTQRIFGIIKLWDCVGSMNIYRVAASYPLSETTRPALPFSQSIEIRVFVFISTFVDVKPKHPKIIYTCEKELDGVWRMISVKLDWIDVGLR